MSPTRFEATYRVGLGNLNAFFAAWWKQTWFDKANWKRFALYALGIALLHLFAMQTFVRKPVFQETSWNLGLDISMGIAAILLSAVYAFILVFLLAPFITYIVQLAIFAAGPTRRKVTDLKADANGIDKMTGKVESRHKWRDFTRLVETRKAVILFTGRNSATIVPKSAFATPAEAEAFAAFAKAQWAEARSVF